MGRKSQKLTPQDIQDAAPIERQLIQSALRRFVQNIYEPQFIPTGILPFDAVIGGIPTGHITLIGGFPGSGKTLFCLWVASQHLRNGGSVLYIDTEAAVTQQRLSVANIPPETLDTTFFLRNYILLEDCFSDIKTLLHRLAESGKRDKPFLIILDSIASLLPSKWAQATEEAGYIADVAVAGYARTGTIFLAGLPNLLRAANTALIITTHVRADISMGGRGGGTKLFKFYSLEHMSHLILFLSPPEHYTPPFLRTLGEELKDEDKKNSLSYKDAYNRVRIGVRKIQVSSYTGTLPPPTVDISFYYPVVNVPQLGLKTGQIDEIYHVLVYGSLPQVGVLERIVKPGVGTVFYYRLNDDKILQFSYIDAYTHERVRNLLLTEVAEKVKEVLPRVLIPQVKGKSVLREVEELAEKVEAMESEEIYEESDTETPEF